jgi:nuclear-control-of-ATPase protein 2
MIVGLWSGSRTMSYLFNSSPPSYAEEQLVTHLSSLSTLAINLPPSSQQSYSASPQQKASPHLQAALSELSSTRPLTRQQVVDVLKTLDNLKSGEYGVTSEIDRVVEAEILSRAVTIVWKDVLEGLLRDALELEEERSWWESTLGSRGGVVVYLLQSG